MGNVDESDGKYVKEYINKMESYSLIENTLSIISSITYAPLKKDHKAMICLFNLIR